MKIKMNMLEQPLHQMYAPHNPGEAVSQRYFPA